MHFRKFPLVLCLAAAVSMSTSGLMAADKKSHGKGKSSSHHVVNRSAGPSHRASAGHGGSRHVSAAKHVSSGGRAQHMASAQRATGNRHVTSSRHTSKSVASGSHHVSKSDAGNRITRSQLASRSDNRRVHQASRANHTDRRSTAISSPSVRRSDSDRHHRDRSHYTQRREHHSSDWYRSHGWSYDRDYWRTHHHHRYYNDLLGVYIIDNFAPDYYPYGYDSGYGYGYSEPYTQPVYGSDFGADYSTRVAVQDALAQAGYYNGPIDGIIGSGTRSAISNYQYDAGLSVTGMIDNALIDSLGIQ
jgi:hypothetical protein